MVKNEILDTYIPMTIRTIAMRLLQEICPLGNRQISLKTSLFGTQICKVYCCLYSLIHIGLSDFSQRLVVSRAAEIGNNELSFYPMDKLICWFRLRTPSTSLFIRRAFHSVIPSCCAKCRMAISSVAVWLMPKCLASFSKRRLALSVRRRLVAFFVMCITS